MFDNAKEIDSLAKMLDDAGIAYKRVKEHGRNQIAIRRGDLRLSAICHMGSYGYEAGLIECWNFDGEEDPAGWLNAKEAFDWMIAHGAKHEDLE